MIKEDEDEVMKFFKFEIPRYKLEGQVAAKNYKRALEILDCLHIRNNSNKDLNDLPSYILDKRGRKNSIIT